MLGELGCVMGSSSGGHWNWVSESDVKGNKFKELKKKKKVLSLQLHSEGSSIQTITGFVTQDLIHQKGDFLIDS